MVTSGNPLPLVFPTIETNIASYTWTDMIAGLGYKRFYGVCDIHTGPAATYFLTSNQPDSPTANYTSGTRTYRGHKTQDRPSLDLDFDMTFNVPAIIEAAPAIVCFTRGVVQEMTCSTVVTVYHVRGVTETSLGTATCVPAVHPAGAEGMYREMLSITLTRKEFAIGDKLRVTFYLAGADEAIEYVLLYHDGSDASVTDYYGLTKGTNLTIDVPFKIDI